MDRSNRFTLLRYPYQKLKLTKLTTKHKKQIAQELGENTKKLTFKSLFFPYIEKDYWKDLFVVWREIDKRVRN